MLNRATQGWFGYYCFRVPLANGIRLNDLRYAIGPGLRYQTPVGPIRFELGYQLNPMQGLLVNGAPERRRWRIHFSIGQAF